MSGAFTYCVAEVGPTLAIIVPVHNELGNIAPFYERTRAVLETLPAVSWQMVFVNDGSDDGSLERICEVRARDERVKVITLSRDFGYHAVLLAGLSMVTADRYAMIDVDCEDPPELLRDFHAALEGGADVAYGIRSNRVEPAMVTFFRRLFYYINKEIADSDIVLWMAEFAMVSRQVRDAIIAPHTTYVFLRAEIGYVGFVRVGIPYVRGVRTSGTSHYNFFNMTRFAVAGFLASSTFPLRLILYVAVVIGLLFPLVAALAGLGAAGIASLASVATFYFALVALSTIALYLARTYKNGVARPVFVVDKNKTYL
jgi:polyisoprenyl-phosphate glycosyltransferase